jgi:hypothetical protein
MDLGFIEDPRVIAVDLCDAKNPLATGSADVSLVGPAADYDANIVPDRTDPNSARLLVRLRDLPPGEYDLQARMLDRAANEARISLRFNTRGQVFMAQTLPIIDDSGKLNKPLGGLDTQFYRAQQEGDYVVYDLTVPEVGRYELTLIASGYPSYGEYQVSLDGQQVGEPVDAYRPALDTTGVVVPLGKMHLDAGQHRLRFDVIGKNEQGNGYFIGWHSIVLRPVTE